MGKILIIEDDPTINDMLGEALTRSGYECVSAYSGTEGILRMEQGNISLVLLDLMLPGMGGDEVLKRGKEIIQAPFIILSAIDDLNRKVSLLTAGADDYLTKPFQLEELRARIMVQLRKTEKVQQEDILEHKKLKLDRNKHVVTLQGEELIVTQQEFKILELLLKNKDKVYSKQEIYQYAWDDYYIGEDKTINVHISNIRQKMKKISDEEYIDTIWGLGFRLTK